MHLFFAICCLVFYVVQLGTQTENSNEVHVIHSHKLQHQLNLEGGSSLRQGSAKVFLYCHDYHEFPTGELAALHTTSPLVLGRGCHISMACGHEE